MTTSWSCGPLSDLPDIIEPRGPEGLPYDRSFTAAICPAQPLGGAAVIAVNGSYQPQWMRLGEAAAYLEQSRSISPQAAKDWLLRVMQDVLRGDRIRYPQQNIFRVQGYPMRWTRRGSPDWPMQLTPAEINWDQSTVVGQHPVKIIEVDLLIEVSAAALMPSQPASPGVAANSGARPGIQTASQATAENACGEFLRALPKVPRIRKEDAEKLAREKFTGLSANAFGRQWGLHAHAEWRGPGAPRKPPQQ